MRLAGGVVEEVVEANLAVTQETETLMRALVDPSDVAEVLAGVDRLDRTDVTGEVVATNKESVA